MEITESLVLSPRAKRYQELDRLAFELGPNMDDKKLFSLKLEEMSYALSMAHLYMLSRLGALSPDMGAKIKRQYILRTEQIHSKLVYLRYMHQRMIACTKTYSKDMNELVELLKSGSAEALPKALEIIDTLSSSYIFSTIYEHYAKGTDIKAVIDELDVADESKERLKAALGCFLQEIEEDKLPSVFEELSEEDLKLISSRIPARELMDSGIPEELKLKL